ncbi:MAG: LuxR C-terminal-related transcriptional regulator [Alphaproteobacteria bacterium]
MGERMIVLAGVADPFRDTLVQGLKRCLPSPTIVEVDSIEDVLKRLAESRELELVVSNVALIDDRACEKLERLLVKRASVRFIVTGHQPSREDIVRGLEIGAAAYIPDSLSAAEVVNAIDLVNAGAVFAPLPPEAQRPQQTTNLAARSRFVLPQRRMPAAQELTPRLRTVLSYLAQGASNKEIAAQLGIAEGTVKVHVSAIIKQFGALNRNDAVQRSAEFNADLG